jgi:hypothetical protein
MPLGTARRGARQCAALDTDGARGQERLGALGPLDQGDAVAAHEVEQAEVDQLGQAGGAVGVDVVHGQAASVLVDEHEGRARRAALDAQAAHEALHEAGLPRPQLPVERDHVAGAEVPAEGLARRRRRLRGRGGEARGRHRRA